MRACEYLDAGSDQRTRTVLIGEVEFRQGDRRQSVDFGEEKLATASTVPVTYRSQKNGDKGTTITQHRAGQVGICPVQAFAGLATRISGYNLPKPRWAAVGDQPLNLVLDETGVLLVTASPSGPPPEGGNTPARQRWVGFPDHKNRDTP
jgi:hypothetical protein